MPVLDLIGGCIPAFAGMTGNTVFAFLRVCQDLEKIEWELNTHG